MCGILGCLHNKEFSFSLNNFELSLKEFSYRGPDGSGTKEFVVDNYILKSGHVRLSIQDLTELASQPMVSESKRFCLSFNGEIYNHHEIRKELESKFHPNWKGTGDTETLLFLLEAKGVKSSLKKIEGMFSFSLFDLQKKKIYLARDHSGEKPLYISTSPKSLSFASDLNPLKKFPFFKKEINELALQKYLEFNYIPNPESIFVGSFKLPPGCFIEIDLNKFKTQFHSSFNSFISAPGVKLIKWWDLDKVREKNLDRKFKNLT